ncbi:methyltransferase domain-containing protein [Planosporangium thailandense]|uniref:Methyltransferase domain-containing protein n=1 Tax=Planosporangium thailandense TaxID=765197 RepID=A0ABX0XWK5_9ACTN|nr:methyltransferase domain-containing protein [Planosporangium thailandense]
MDLDRLAALLTPEGAEALTAAADVATDDPLSAASALRARSIPPELAASALTQAVLRRKAEAKFGADARAMFFTRAGLEQATRAEVATRRAARLAASGARTVADLGCGVGADAIAFARAGLRVRAVDADPVTAAVAAANVTALGLADRVSVAAADARDVALDDVDAVFCDPARRTAAGRRVFDPNAYSPPWDFVVGLAGRVPRTVLKLAPGIDHDLVPPGAEAEWVSVRGEVVEAAFWCGPLAAVPRRATLLRDGEAHELTGSGQESAPVGPVRRYVYDPDGAVVRAHLVAEFAATVGGTLADPTIAYVYADAATATPYARCLEIIDTLPFSVKRLRSALHARGVGRITITKRGSAVDVERLRRDLRLTGDAELTVVLTRVAGAQTALLCVPA